LLKSGEIMAQAGSFGQRTVEMHREEWGRLREAEARRKRLVAHERECRRAELEQAATPETLHKARACVAQRMFDRGQMTADQLRAAQEIGKVFEAITRTLFATTSRFGAVGGGSAEDWPASLRRSYRNHYIPWRDEQARIVVGAGKSRCDVVFSVAVDNYGPSQLAQHLRMDHRKVKDHVCESLYRYAEIAGWITLPVPAIRLVSEAVGTAA
jgi:hypothetical protein